MCRASTTKETIKKLSDELKELRKDPHTALNKSEKKIELILHKIVEAENYQIRNKLRLRNNKHYLIIIYLTGVVIEQHAIKKF